LRDRHVGELPVAIVAIQFAGLGAGRVIVKVQVEIAVERDSHVKNLDLLAEFGGAIDNTHPAETFFLQSPAGVVQRCHAARASLSRAD
jgi:hypothetical protein